MIRKSRKAICIACLSGCILSTICFDVSANDQAVLREKIYTNNKNFLDSNNLETFLEDMLGLNQYPEKRLLLDSNEASIEHNRLRKKMLSN